MHSHERTLIQSLQLDPDRKTSDHELACQYLYSRARTIIELIAVPEDKDFKVKPQLEQIITKGEGQYKTHIGFLDLVIETTDVVVDEHYDCYKWVVGPRERNRRLAVEVKTSQTPVSSILQQLGLYREYYKAHGWLLATTYDLTQVELGLLEDAHISHLRISDEFRKYQPKTGQMRLI